MNKIVIKCPAKINLSLDVLNRLENGYHNVRMIMLEVGLCDILTIELCDGSVELYCNNPDVPLGTENLCYKACELFFRKYGTKHGVKIYLEKNIPIGAGLAGGSTDAAGTLKGLNALLGNPFSERFLREMGKELGADIPFCIIGGCALAEGIGDILTPIKCGINANILIAKPAFSVSTAWVYKNLKLNSIGVRPNIENVILAVKNGNLNLLAENTANVLETVTAAEYKEIEQFKSIMRDCGAAVSLMSGSGPSVFGIFENNSEAESAAAELRKFTNEVYIT